MKGIDIVLLALYSMAIGCSLYIIHRHKAYFHERFQKGVVSVFMLVMLFFLMAYTFKMLIVLLAHFADVYGFLTPELETWLLYGWTLAQLGTTAGLIALAALTHSGRYDQFIYFRRIDRKGEGHADSDTGSK
ncbi:hypothetical protein SAMN04487895_12833 [Paenibacillus sophorae]|uniref:Uncharacterized protein n=1 Tax=Paenibacillus sophorae TaxID=1333845 RepID=A0A1H8VW76_9BACL|nr:hypothetical protein [Paenibacillus sophorae]QWU15631.1 hypothetical protein KP014_27975 [Paenibacillus sophorae]SEP19605.1 hypothetical protein SAMN04487895_12833 [Paenibacillus sophorae]